jgi:hypothetical protein
MSMSSLSRITELMKLINNHFRPPHGMEHALALYADDGGPKLALHVWTEHSIRMVGFEEGDFDRPPQELAAEIIQLIEGTKNESRNEPPLS